MYAKYAELRDSLGFTDYEVALKTGIPQSTLYDWRQRSVKNPEAELSFGNILKIAKLFEVNMEAFVVGDS
ncbi:MAG: helix-turn-helix transcriptional regulator [Ruminococcus sp.]|nr:helix-turn-helix transcriptional regulator [Ruminococcus sp.]